MLLIICDYFCKLIHIINNILLWIEYHDTFVGVVVTVLTGSVWINRYLNNKRREAYCGFYSRLKMQIEYLGRWLKKNDLLNITNPTSGNIYALKYDTATLSNACPGFHTLDADYICTLKKIVSKIQETLLKTESNVNPRKCSKIDWDNYLLQLYDFCEFIIQDDLYGKTNECEDTNGNFIHIEDCKLLISTMKNIVSLIDDELSKGK